MKNTQNVLPSNCRTLIDPNYHKLLCIETPLVLVPSTETMFLFEIGWVTPTQMERELSYGPLVIGESDTYQCWVDRNSHQCVALHNTAVSIFWYLFRPKYDSKKWHQTRKSFGWNLQWQLYYILYTFAQCTTSVSQHP